MSTIFRRISRRLIDREGAKLRSYLRSMNRLEDSFGKRLAPSLGTLGKNPSYFPYASPHPSYLRVRNKSRSPKYEHATPHISGSRLRSERTEEGISVKNVTIRELGSRLSLSSETNPC